jgi:hypothetical protein
MPDSVKLFRADFERRMQGLGLRKKRKGLYVYFEDPERYLCLREFYSASGGVSSCDVHLCSSFKLIEAQVRQIWGKKWYTTGLRWRHAPIPTRSEFAGIRRYFYYINDPALNDFFSAVIMSAQIELENLRSIDCFLDDFWLKLDHSYPFNDNTAADYTVLLLCAWQIGRHSEVLETMRWIEADNLGDHLSGMRRDFVFPSLKKTFSELVKRN